MMEWIPIIFVAFKALVLCTGMFFAVKWHYDQGKKGKQIVEEMRMVMRAGGMVTAVFMVLLLGLGLATFVLGKTLGLDLTLP
ncbi:hypothetical protein GCM10027277_00500 [Pseudoduganella ginsengisoli]|uniref:Uncharacterized protein n=1 Tax=Pseudoduganella ginsengisoli TaxID=1462440 RepID=A0A6L6Q382_9BURK|nr:hypothetical protein [Pseudoduganella ginsengisoli]MTW03884.1 hypothetical protein [Pseudoduganella ginsengisoli]